MASWLARSTLDRAVLVRTLAGDIVLGKTLNVTMSLSTRAYKWVPANLMLWRNPSMD